MLESAHHGLAVSPARRGTGHWLVPQFMNTAGVEVGRTFVLVACVVVGEVSVDVARATILPSMTPILALWVLAWNGTITTILS